MSQISQITSVAIAKDLNLIHKVSPLVHSITNFVVMEQTANALLALGASPIMAHAIDEVSEIVVVSKALVINIGTLDQVWVESMRQAMRIAKEYSVPIILDPVGAGATTFRTETVLSLINEIAPDVIRGNAAEIMALAGESIDSKGVDSQYDSFEAEEASSLLAKRYSSVVVVSGEKDWITNASERHSVQNGVPMMAKVTGMGCTATALIGAFCAVNPNYFFAAAHAMAVMGIAGEEAFVHSEGPGSFKNCFIDQLYSLNESGIERRLKVES